MKWSALALCCCITCVCTAQTMNLKELTSLLDVPPGKLDNLLQRKGFRKTAHAGEGASVAFMRSNKEGSSLQYFWLDTARQYVYETNSPDEFNFLKKEMKAAGFQSSNEDTSGVQPLAYQRQVITIETSSRLIDTSLFYVLKTIRKNLPRKKDIAFAEDLLMLDSHEYLGEMFGEQQVTADLFYYANDDSARCSVLFPKTNLEAIIVWKDGANLREIEFILIGGSLRASGGSPANVQSFSQWRSKQGIYCGMSLKELHAANGAPVKFFNWHSASAGHLVPRNKGAIDFESLDLVLSCMNCGFIQIGSTDVLDSETAINEMQKAYVSSLIVLPPKK